MKQQRFSEEQIIGVLKEGEAGAKVADLCRKHGISDATYYNWKAKYGGLVVSQARRTAVTILMTERALGVTRACGLVGISRSLFRYQPRDNGNLQLRERLVELAGQKRRYGYRRLHVLLRREGILVNRKRTYRLYREAGLTVRRRRRKHIGSTERQPLAKPAAPHISWSMDFVADGLVGGRRLRCLNIVDDCTRECLAIEVDTSLPGKRVTAVLNRLADLRGLPLSITADNGPEFAGSVVDAWAYERGVHMSFIRPGKPIENAYIESFNGRFRDECLNEHWFLNMAHARAVIERWRVEYNTERPHSSLGYLTPAQFAKAIMTPGEDEVPSTSDSNSGRD